MYAVLAEDTSDAEVVACIMKRYFANSGVRIRKKGYDGCSGLRRKGARDIRTWIDQGIERFVVCHDADRNAPSEVFELVCQKVVLPAGATGKCCVAVPVQEIESWLIADEAAIHKVIPSFAFRGHTSPETIQDPKEWLVKQSQASNGKPLYSPKTFNAAVADHVRFEVLASKCPSFRSFLACISRWKA